MGSGWMAFWDDASPIIVGARHRDEHYRRIATDVMAAVDLRGKTVLDYGCGEALAAPLLAQAARQVLLYDAAPHSELRLKARHAGQERIRVLSPADWQALAPASLDAVVIVSVLQYLDPPGLAALLDRLAVLLRPDGRVLFGDVVPPGQPPLKDVLALLKSGLDHGFFWEAVATLARTLSPRYRRIRKEAGFSMHEPRAFLEKLAAHGLSGRLLDKNVGFNPSRYTVVARKAAP